MKCVIRKWKIEDATRLAEMLPYVILVVLEIVIGLLLSLFVKKKGLIKEKSSKVLDM